MKKLMMWIVMALILLTACARTIKPAYETRSGKQKLRYYNAIQFGQKDIPKPPKYR